MPITSACIVTMDACYGVFGKRTYNDNGEKLVSFLTEVDHLSCNSCTFVTELEWTSIRSVLKQKFVLDYVVADIHMLKN